MSTKTELLTIAKGCQEFGEWMEQQKHYVNMMSMMHPLAYKRKNTPISIGGFACLYYSIDKIIMDGYCVNGSREGTDALSKACGFKDHHEFYRWAKRCSKLWGNTDGEYMWVLVSAYNIEGSVITAAEIGKHFIGVAERCRKAALKKNI